MAYYDTFTKEVDEKVNAWKQTESELNAEVEKQTGLIEEYKAALENDYQSGSATDETAQTALNLNFAERRLKEAQAELAEHEKAKLYTIDEYNDARKEIRDACQDEYESEKEGLTAAISDCMEILIRINGYADEASKCDSYVKSACRECGQNVSVDFGSLHAKTPMNIIPDTIGRAMGSLSALMKSL